MALSATVLIIDGFDSGLAHQKIPIVIHDYRDFLIIRFGMRTLQAASEDFTLNFLVRLAPSVARISISRPGHQYLHMSNTSAYAGIFLSKNRQARSSDELRAF